MVFCVSCILISENIVILCKLYRFCISNNYKVTNGGNLIWISIYNKIMSFSLIFIHFHIIISLTFYFLDYINYINKEFLLSLKTFKSWHRIFTIIMVSFSTIYLISVKLLLFILFCTRCEPNYLFPYLFLAKLRLDRFEFFIISNFSLFLNNFLSIF